MAEKGAPIPATNGAGPAVEAGEAGEPLLKEEAGLEELKGLMKKRKTEAVEAVGRDWGGTERLCGLLHSGPGGLEPSRVDAARATYGENRVPPKPPKSFLRLCWEAVGDPILIILICAGIVSIGIHFVPAPEEELRPYDKEQRARHEPKSLGHSEREEGPDFGWVEGAAILGAVLVVVLVTAVNDWNKERQFRGLQSKVSKSTRANVVRGGAETEVGADELVVGDLLHVKYGDTVPADGILLRAHQLLLDESSLTGESELVTKSPEADPVLLSGTHVMEGGGSLLVLAVGLHSQSGQIMALMGATAKVKGKEQPKDQEGGQEKPKEPKEKEEEEGSVLQTKLTKLATSIGLVGTALALLIFLVMVTRYSIVRFGVEKRRWIWHNDMMGILQFFILGITVLVVAVPEGLPLAVTISLAYSVSKMMKDNNLVRHLSACETMGNATTICSDKTGTLTTNRMTTVQLWLGGLYHRTLPEAAAVPADVLHLLAEGISLNSSYQSRIQDAKEPGQLPAQLGNKTECGLLGLVLHLGLHYDAFRSKFPSESFVKVLTFNSKRKSMSSVVRTESGLRLYSKGASEVMLSRCVAYLGDDGLSYELTGEIREALLKDAVMKMASSGLRTIGLAYKELGAEEGAGLAEEMGAEAEERLVSGLTLVGVAGIQDPVRDEVPAAVAACQRAGVTVRMVTGDNVETARSIALTCGIVRPDDDEFLVLEAKDFNRRVRDSAGNVSQELMDQLWPKLRVLARAQPEDKFVLVKGIMSSEVEVDGRRSVVAVTGDGTNDGPALKKADVGFAMGIAGTDVAKEASDIILTDDNFSSIVKAVMWGRNVYDSIAKFIQFQLTVNVVAVLVAMIGAVVLNKSPLAPIQMLWVNLIMDCLASLALATEQPTEELLHRKPYGRTKPIISRLMARNILGQAAYQLTVLLALTFVPQVAELLYLERLDSEGGVLDGPSQHFTIVFNTFVLATLFNEVSCRKVNGERNVLAGVTRNPWFLGIWSTTLVLQFIIVQFGWRMMKTAALTPQQWMWCVFLGLGGVLWQQLVFSVPVGVMPECLAVGGASSPSSLSRDRTASLRRPSRRGHAFSHPPNNPTNA